MLIGVLVGMIPEFALEFGLYAETTFLLQAS
jgi:hypothetical protein